MDQVYGEVVTGALKALCARRAEIDWTLKTIETNPDSISSLMHRNSSVDGEIRGAIDRLYEVRSLVEDTILHLTRLARMRR